MRRLTSSAIMILFGLGCGGDDAPSVAAVVPDASADASAAQACLWPTPAASCTPRADFLSCVVPDGDSVAADGTVVDSNGKPVPGACKNLCKSTDYSLGCAGNDPASPAFAGSLGCTSVPVPTPFGVTFWCCPCAE